MTITKAANFLQTASSQRKIELIRLLRQLGQPRQIRRLGFSHLDFQLQAAQIRIHIAAGRSLLLAVALLANHIRAREILFGHARSIEDP